MGFGLLFLGYFVANMMALNILGGLFRFVGYIIVLIAAKKLMQYNHRFNSLLLSSIAMVAVSALGAFGDVTSFLYKYALIPTPILNQAIVDILSATRMFLDFIFTAVLCFAVNGIAQETGATKIVVASVRNFIFYCIYFVLQLAVWIAYLTENTSLINFVVSAAIPVCMVLVNLICILLILYMLYSCYAGICDADAQIVELPTPKLEIFKRKNKK